MQLISCKCLNVKIYAERLIDTLCKDLPPQEYFSNNFFEVVLSSTKICFVNACLIKKIELENWIVYHCVSCNTTTHACSSILAIPFNHILANSSLLKEEEEIKGLVSSHNFSKLYNIVIQWPSYPLHAMEETTESREVEGCLQRSYDDFLNKQEQLLTERIKDYEQTEKNKFLELKSKLSTDKDTLVMIVLSNEHNNLLCKEGIWVSCYQQQNSGNELENVGSFVVEGSSLERNVVGKTIGECVGDLTGGSGTDTMGGSSIKDDIWAAFDSLNISTHQTSDFDIINTTSTIKHPTTNILTTSIVTTNTTVNVSSTTKTPPPTKTPITSLKTATAPKARFMVAVPDPFHVSTYPVIQEEDEDIDDTSIDNNKHDNHNEKNDKDNNENNLEENQVNDLTKDLISNALLTTNGVNESLQQKPIDTDDRLTKRTTNITNDLLENISDDFMFDQGDERVKNDDDDDEEEDEISEIPMRISSGKSVSKIHHRNLMIEGGDDNDGNITNYSSSVPISVPRSYKTLSWDKFDKKPPKDPEEMAASIIEMAKSCRQSDSVELFGDLPRSIMQTKRFEVVSRLKEMPGISMDY